MTERRTAEDGSLGRAKDAKDAEVFVLLKSQNSAVSANSARETKPTGKRDGDRFQTPRQNGRKERDCSQRCRTAGHHSPSARVVAGRRRWPKNMKWIIAIAATVMLNTILILWGRGSFLAAIIALGASFWIGLPVIIVSAVCFAIAARRNSARLMSIAGSGIAAGLVIFSTLLSIPIGNKFVDHDVHEAKAFCEDLVPKMELIREQTGGYPRDISALLGGIYLPHLFEPRWYHCDGTNFSFTIVDPGTIMGGWSYDNQRKKWDYWD